MPLGLKGAARLRWFLPAARLTSRPCAIGVVAGIDAAENFLAVNRHFVRADEAQLHAVAANFDNGHLDVFADHDPFVFLPAEHEHVTPPFACFPIDLFACDALLLASPYGDAICPLRGPARSVLLIRWPQSQSALPSRRLPASWTAVNRVDNAAAW
jgi:hypothetical protein